MGGMGSGRRWGHGAKYTTGDYRSLDIRQWQREGLLTAGRLFDWKWFRRGEESASIWVFVESPERALFVYDHRERQGDWEERCYPVYLDWTPCNFGGKRPWFLCPNCRQRVAILYADSIFTCRHCCDLAYPSQRETLADRAARRADRIRERLGWEPGILNGSEITNKPKGMHWQTFSRLVAEHDKFVGESLAGMAEQLNFKS